MENEKLRVENEEWRVEKGKGERKNVKWRVESGE